MVSFNKPTGSFDFETGVRLLLLLNNSIALALNFACMAPLFIAVGSILAVSVLFNLLVLLVKVRSNRLSSSNDDDQKRCPSLIVWTIEILGVAAFFSLYIASTIDIADNNNWWQPTLLMAYASIGTLVAL